MSKLLDALRRNPDAIALAVLCVVLGAGRQVAAARPTLMLSNTTLGLHWVCVKPATEAMDNLRARIRHLGCGALESLRLPDLHR
jgi:hypothetical protein